jgi:hypothetical protein
MVLSLKRNLSRSESRAERARGLAKMAQPTSKGFLWVESKMKNVILVLSALLGFSVSAISPAQSAVCDAALVNTAYSSGTVTHNDWRLSLLINSENYEQAKHDAGASAVIYGVPVSANYSDYSQNREKLFQTYNESRTIDEMRNVAWTALDPNSATAYSDCLRVELAGQIGLQAVVWSATASDITIMVRWFVPGENMPATVSWTPPSIKGISFPTSIPQGTTAIVVPRPNTQQSFVGSFRGFATTPIVLEPLPRPSPPIASCRKETVTVPAKNYDPNKSRNLQIGVIYGPDFIHNAPPYGHAENMAQYEIYFTCGGTYLIKIEYAAGETRPVELTLHNDNGYQIRRTVLSNITGSWTVPVLTDQGVADIPKGALTMILFRSDYFPHIRTIQFEPVN